MKDFTVKKVVSFPQAGVPNCFYTCRSDIDHFQARMAVKDGSKLLKLICDNRTVKRSALVITGPTAKKFSTIADLEISNSDPNVTSYDVIVNGGSPTNITDNSYGVLMSDTPGDVMVVTFIPKDDIGTNYHPVTYDILTTVGPPIDSGLTVDGPIECPQDYSIDLILNDYLPEIDRLDYTVGLSSLMSVDPAQSPPKTITISPIGEIGQTVMVKFTPETDDFNEYMPVIHYVTIIDKPEIPSGATFTGPNSTPQNVPVTLELDGSAPIIGYTVYTNTDPALTWEITNPDQIWDVDLNEFPVGSDVIFTAVPHDGTDQPYIPLTKTVHIDPPQVTDSGVTLTGDPTASKTTEYTLGFNKPNNADIIGYHVWWGSEDKGEHFGDPSEWINDYVTGTLGDTVSIRVEPLSATNVLYGIVTKDVTIIAAPAIEHGINFWAGDEYPVGGVYDLKINRDNQHPEVDWVQVIIDGNVVATLNDTDTSWDMPLTGYGLGDTETVRLQPGSDNPEFTFKDVELEFTMVAGASTDSGFTAVPANEVVTVGDSTTYTLTYPADVNAVDIWYDGILLESNYTGTSWTTFNTPMDGEKRYLFEFIPKSSTPGTTYNTVYSDIATKWLKEPVDSGLTWSGPETAIVGDPITYIRNGSCPDLDYVEVWVEGVLKATLNSSTTSYTYPNTDYTEGKIVDFVFKTFSTTPGREYVDEDEETLLEGIPGIPNIELTKSGPTTMYPWGIINWTFDLTNNNITTVDISGPMIQDGTGLDPNNTEIRLTSEVNPGDVIQVCVTAYDDTGLSTIPVKCYDVTISDWVSNVPTVTNFTCGNDTLLEGGVVTFDGPNITPTSEYDSIDMEVELLIPSNNNSVHTWKKVNVASGVAVSTTLPTAVGEMGLDVLIPPPDIAEIQIRAHFDINRNGSTWHRVTGPYCSLAYEEAPVVTTPPTTPPPTTAIPPNAEHNEEVWTDSYKLRPTGAGSTRSSADGHIFYNGRVLLSRPSNTGAFGTNNLSHDWGWMHDQFVGAEMDVWTVANASFYYLYGENPNEPVAFLHRVRTGDTYDAGTEITGFPLSGTDVDSESATGGMVIDDLCTPDAMRGYVLMNTRKTDGTLDLRLCRFAYDPAVPTSGTLETILTGMCSANGSNLQSITCDLFDNYLVVNRVADSGDSNAIWILKRMDDGTMSKAFFQENWLDENGIAVTHGILIAREYDTNRLLTYDLTQLNFVAGQGQTTPLNISSIQTSSTIIPNGTGTEHWGHQEFDMDISKDLHFTASDNGFRWPMRLYTVNLTTRQIDYAGEFDAPPLATDIARYCYVKTDGPTQEMMVGYTFAALFQPPSVNWHHYW